LCVDALSWLAEGVGEGTWHSIPCLISQV
jgi:hypothetical protein